MLSITQNNLLDTASFAQLVDISIRKARAALANCHNGKTWRGTRLNVLINKGKGGKSGLQYLVQRDSIPPQFLKNVSAHDASTINNPFPIIESVNAAADNSAITDLVPVKQASTPQVKYKVDEFNFKLDIVKRVINETDQYTPERAALIKELAATARYTYGKRRGQSVSENAIRDWINKYEHGGMLRICRKSRNDNKKKRVMISKAWDKAVKNLKLNEDDQLKLVDELKRRFKSLWRSGTPSVPTVQLNVLSFAMHQLKESGCMLDDAELRSTCKFPEKLISSFSHYKLANIHRNDAAKYAAKHTPRIKRHRNNLEPMEWVAGDVHHIDIIFQREDGSTCTPKAVAWLDLATNRTFITTFIMKPGEMIRREHVLESFVAMCADPSWGVPTRLYVDRGGEYNWGELIEDLCKLKHNLDVRSFDDYEDDTRNSGMNRSTAYVPQSKVIEGLFSSLEKAVFSQVKGFIGGDRMKNKTQNQGKAPMPYQGDFEAFENSLKVCVDYYHIKGQQGHLNGDSPIQRFKEFIAGGWRSTVLDPEDLAIAFCKKAFREVRPGGVFSWAGAEYRHDSLIALAGIRKVEVGEPYIGDKNRLVLFDEAGHLLGIAEPVRQFAFGDVSGAGEQSRQAKLHRQHVYGLESETDKLDLENEMRSAVEVMGGTPLADVGNIISISEKHAQVAKEGRDNPNKSIKQEDSDKQFELLGVLNKKAEAKKQAAG
ncbi:MAG: hypothetical protein HOP23_18310 [Methylococcaceae bacterium]|nr:hypothetical protein [Methylococcaceae bacterium]